MKSEVHPLRPLHLRPHPLSLSFSFTRPHPPAACCTITCLPFPFSFLFVLPAFSVDTLYYLALIMDSRHRRLSAHSQLSLHTDSPFDHRETAQAASSRLQPGAQLTLWRYLQDLPNADVPPTDVPPRYHTGRLPNSKAGDGKPRLLLRGQRR